jgi:hypothetical protein
MKFRSGAPMLTKVGVGEFYGGSKAVSELKKFYGFDALLPTVRKVTLPDTKV